LRSATIHFRLSRPIGFDQEPFKHDVRPMGCDACGNRPARRFGGGGRIDRKHHRTGLGLMRQFMRDRLHDNRSADHVDRRGCLISAADDTT
jgi:hypothetical protein